MVLLAAVGCGSSALPPDGGGDTASVSCGDPTLAIDPTALIDNMESPAPATVMGATRGGSWWAGGDPASKAIGAAIVPDGPATAEMIPGGRCGSMYAVHVTGQGFGTWSVVNVSFGWDAAAQKLLPYDASFRAGITFWARIGDTSTNNVRLNITDKYSNDQGGICDKTVPNGDTACYDHFGVALTGLDVGWHQYKIPFGGLGQLMFGIPRPSLDTTSLYSIDFNFPLSSVFDFWVDDISFY
jgi:hypothetical protein